MCSESLTGGIRGRARFPISRPARAASAVAADQATRCLISIQSPTRESSPSEVVNTAPPVPDARDPVRSCRDADYPLGRLGAHSWRIRRRVHMHMNKIVDGLRAKTRRCPRESIIHPRLGLVCIAGRQLTIGHVLKLERTCEK